MVKSPPGHATVKRKSLPWVYCRKCGLLYLRNLATQKAIKAPL